LLCYDRPIASADPFVFESINQLLDQMNAQAPWPPAAGRLGLGCGRLPRIERPPVIDDLHVYAIGLSDDPHAYAVVAALGPAIADDVTGDFVECDLQLHQRFARDPKPGSDPVQAIAQLRDLRQIVTDDQLNALSGGLRHDPDVATL
jgi:hypothetical protein